MNTTCSVNAIDAWIPSEIEAISPLVDQLMRMIQASRCVEGNEFEVEPAFREALSNAVIHGNGMDAHKLVEVDCRCEEGKGVLLTVKDQGKDLIRTRFAMRGFGRSECGPRTRHPFAEANDGRGLVSASRDRGANA